MNKIFVIVGPTGVGKSRLGVQIAKRFNGEIISGDSMQVYKGLDIASAKIKEEEKEGIKHHLIDIVDLDEPYSVSNFQKDCRRAIEDIQKRGKLVLIVGGSGLYHKAALYDYDFSFATSSFSELEAKYKDFTSEQLYELLVALDPESAKILHPNNRRRVLRAVDIHSSSGKTKTEIIQSQKHEPLYDVYFIGLTIDRDKLYEIIDKRVEEQIKEGLVLEAQKIYSLDENKQTVIQSIGYKELIPYFKKEITLEEALSNIKKVSRNYAKRQMTWFRHQVDVNWFTVDVNNFKKTIEDVSDFIENKLKEN